MAGQQLTTQEKAGWRNRCAEVGLEVVDVERQGEILVLHLGSDSSRPTAQQLRQAAEELKGDGIRYVTVELTPRGVQNA